MFQAKPETSPFPIVLLVDDHDRTLAKTAAALRRQGLGVLEARTSVEALLLGVEFVGPISALVTTLALSRYCNGSELADCLRTIRPEMRVCYMLEDELPDQEIARELVRGEAELLSPVSPAKLKALAFSLFTAESPAPA